MEKFGRQMILWTCGSGERPELWTNSQQVFCAVPNSHNEEVIFFLGQVKVGLLFMTGEKNILISSTTFSLTPFRKLSSLDLRPFACPA